MNFLPGFYALGYAALFLLLIPLVLFYFLKLKRPQMEVPSLALWQQVLNDQRVNSPFQKFKRNLLLLLQAILLCLLVLAAMQPFIQAGPQRAEYLPVLIDCSASMAALDKQGGQSRLDAAKQRVGELIDNLLPDQQMSLVTVHSTARRITDFTNNKRVLREALNQIEVLDVPSDIEDGLRITQALSRTVPIDTALLYSDGNIPGTADFELPFELSYQQLDPAGQNVGITALNARRAGTARWEVFCRIEGSQGAQDTASVELLQNGERVAEETVFIQDGEPERLVFRLDTDEAASVELRLKPGGFDSLPTDNVAYLDLPAPRPIAVYAHTELYAFRHALQALDGVTLFPGDDGTGSAPEYDLVISDRPDDELLESSVALFVGFVPEDLSTLIGIETGSAEIVDWDRASPLLQHVQLSDVQTTDEPQTAEGVEDGDFEQAGYQILAFGRSGPLVLEKRTGVRIEYYVLFHSDHSTLPYRVGFPILVANAVDIALQQADLSEVRGSRTGVLPPMEFEANENYRVVAPGGEQTEVVSNPHAIVAGVAATRIGRYSVYDGSRKQSEVAVSLLDANESSLASIDQIDFRELSVQAAEADVKSDKPLWPMLAMLGFGMLMVEWWYFQRRPGGFASR